jgi:hypothetical protein
MKFMARCIAVSAQAMRRMTSATNVQSMPPSGPVSRVKSSFIASLREVVTHSRAAGLDFDSDIS